MGDFMEAEAEEAQAPYVDTNDARAIQGILAARKSPLPWWTIAAFKYNTPDFDVAGYLAVMACESSMGTTGGSFTHSNPGNIKWGGWLSENPDLEVWHRWMNGNWFCPGQGTYGTYSSMYWGQRAAIRLIYDSEHGYNAKLAAHDWEGFAEVYYGKNVKGKAGYVRCLKVSHDKIVKEAATYGAEW